MTKWTYEATRTGYAKMWDSISIKSTDTANAARFAKKILAAEARYQEVQDATGVPWYFVGALHMRESSCDFKGVLHNGEKIIGTRKKTRLVPANRGPFATWQEAAIDALSLKEKLWVGREWCPSLMGYVSECFNGLGYVGHKTNSPYCWAGSDHEQTGKYVADHVWDKDFDDPQIGTMTVLRALANMREDIDAELAANHKVSPFGRRKPAPAPVIVEEEQSEEPTVTKKPMSTQTKSTIGGGIIATGGAATAGGASYFDSIQPFLDVFSKYGTTIATTLTVAAVVGCVGWWLYEKYEARAAA